MCLENIARNIGTLCLRECVCVCVFLSSIIFTMVFRHVHRFGGLRATTTATTLYHVWYRLLIFPGFARRKGSQTFLHDNNVDNGIHLRMVQVSWFLWSHFFLLVFFSLFFPFRCWHYLQLHNNNNANVSAVLRFYFLVTFGHVDVDVIALLLLLLSLLRHFIFLFFAGCSCFTLKTFRPVIYISIFLSSFLLSAPSTFSSKLTFSLLLSLVLSNITLNIFLVSLLFHHIFPDQMVNRDRSIYRRLPDDFRFTSLLFIYFSVKLHRRGRHTHTAGRGCIIWYSE